MPTHPGSPSPAPAALARVAAVARPGPGETSGVAQYLRLASLLRHQLASGARTVGERLPTVAELADEYGVARVTVRHAYALLSREGLISSRRGLGTFVTARPLGIDDGLRAAIDDPSVAAGHLRFDVLSRESGLALPPELVDGEAAGGGDYVCVRKVHLHDGVPFCLAEIYLRDDVYRRLPRDGERQRKLAHLLIEHGGVELSVLRQTTTVVPADAELARHLDCEFAAPVARVLRRLLDRDGAVVYAGRFWYRGDRFITESEIPVELWLRYPGMAVPRAQPVRGAAASRGRRR